MGTHVLQKYRTGFLEQNSDTFFAYIVGAGIIYVRSSEISLNSPFLVYNQRSFPRRGLLKIVLELVFKSMKKVFLVAGARPNFVKIAPIMGAIKERGRLEPVLINTGQHYDYEMSNVFFKELGIPEPDCNMEVGPGTFAEQCAKILILFEKLCLSDKPSAVILVGDVTSTVACAVSGVKLGVPIAHVEAGLRSFNKFMPEETNRVITDHCSSILFCPTANAASNLLKEGFRAVSGGALVEAGYALGDTAPDCNNPAVLNVGDVMYDVLLSHEDRIRSGKGPARALGLDEKNYDVLTLHRAENTENVEIADKMLGFVRKHSGGRPVVFPIHPRTRKLLKDAPVEFFGGIKMIEPLGYFDMMALVAGAATVFTDSGGLQKEAYWLRVPCVTLRRETEWVETVESGWNSLYRDYAGSHSPVGSDISAYGDGDAAGRIADCLSIFA